jgi:mRNA interferase MazF
MRKTKRSGLGSQGNADAKPRPQKPRIKAAPKPRQIYWCEFWSDAIAPEMWKTRPIIIISHKNRLYGPCLVIPTTTDPDNELNPWAYKLPEIEGELQSWAICNHLITISTSRLSQFSGRIPKLPQQDFDAILELVRGWIPSPMTS